MRGFAGVFFEKLDEIGGIVKLEQVGDLVDVLVGVEDISFGFQNQLGINVFGGCLPCFFLTGLIQVLRRCL